MSGILAIAAVAGVGSALSGPPASFKDCVETVNPSGNPAVGTNAVGGDAVPGGSSTTPGTTVHGPINSDGFYIVAGALTSRESGELTLDIPAPPDFTDNVWNETKIKYTERGNNTEVVVSPNIGGENSVIEWHVFGPGDLFVGETFCGVPPPPF